MANDIFLKVEGIDGESKDSKHEKHIDVLSYSWSESQTGSFATGGGGGTGKVSMADLNVTFLQNKASAPLFLACASGEHIKKIELKCRRAGKTQIEYLVITLSDCLIAGYQTGASTGGETLPVESVSINFAKIEMAYTPQKPDGTADSPVKAGWDRTKNAKV